ncbi:MAG: VCBS repeat-containing protein [Candidatus Bathyarchaeia archaeon]
MEIGTWKEGRYPMDMPVADFNEDGNLDFILTHYESVNDELYLGNGHFGFTRSVLANTAPYYSVGADTADFNNDGHADYVVVPRHEALQLYINLGKGDSTFTRKTSPAKSSYYWGVAAADFDSDGNVDLLASRTDFAYWDFIRAKAMALSLGLRQ